MATLVVPSLILVGHYFDTVLPEGAHSWYKGDGGFWWLGKNSANTTKNTVHLVRFLDDPGPIKLYLRPARYTASTEAVVW